MLLRAKPSLEITRCVAQGETHMVLVPLVAAPSLMFAVSVVLLAVGAELGADAGAALAAGVAAHVVAQVAFALAFAFVVERRGAALGVLAGASAFALGSLLLAPLPTAAAIALAVPALLLGARGGTAGSGAAASGATRSRPMRG